MSNASDSNPKPVAHDEESALFSSLVMQQFSMAMMLMGRTTGPQGEQAPKDLGAARLFIDQLEMLERKTKGNLSTEEERLLKQSLMTLRLSFVEAVEEGQQPQPQQSAQSAPQATPASAAQPSVAPAAGCSEESHKKFTKKY